MTYNCPPYLFGHGAACVCMLAVMKEEKEERNTCPVAIPISMWRDVIHIGVVTYG